MRRSWQLKVLFFFLLIFVIFNIESFLLKTIEFIVRIPLNTHSFMSNVFGVDFWSKIVLTSGNPVLLLSICIFTIIFIVGTIRVIENVKK